MLVTNQFFNHLSVFSITHQFFNREDYKCKVAGEDCQFHNKAIVDEISSENENLARSS